MIITISEAFNLLLTGQVVALPTETVYGLAGLINQNAALEKIFQTKQRPFFDPLIVHVTNLEMAKTLTTTWNPLEEFLAKTFWPGPLTIIKSKNNLVSDLITSSLPSVALRAPKHPVIQELLKKLNTPLAAPSANKFKSTSPTMASHVDDEFNSAVPVVDGGTCLVGIESSIIEVFSVKDTFEIKIYRPGIISKEDLKISLKNTPWENCSINYVSSNVAPGQLAEHYRPKKKLSLVLTNQDKIISLCETTPEAVSPYSEDIFMAARQLYAFIRNADQKKDIDHLIIFFDLEKWNDPAWFAIKERLSKASTNISHRS